MELSEAIRIVIDGSDDTGKYAEAEKLLKARIANIADPESKAATKYYLLRLKLREYSLYETTEQLTLYDDLRSLLFDLEREYWKHYAKNPNSTLEQSQIKVFYNIALYYFGSLETVYTERHFEDSARRAYEDKMSLRRRFYRMQKHYLRWFGYCVLEITSKYGTSFTHWSLTSICTVALFATLYAVSDVATIDSARMVGSAQPFYSYLYHSIVTFAGLGTGTMVPILGFHKFLVALEVISGYLMLGMFINVLHRKL